MSTIDHRSRFADFLTRLAAGAEREGEWVDLVVAHYRNDEIEEIRRELVRLRMKYAGGGRIAWKSEDRDQILVWASRLACKL